MISCPKCGELNAEKRTTCFRCKTGLRSVMPAYRKICPKCKKIYDARQETCEKCQKVLSVYNPDITPDMPAPDSSKWAYLLAVLLPVIGLTAGVVLLVLRHKEAGLMIAVSIIAGILWIVLLNVMTSSFFFGYGYM